MTTKYSASDFRTLFQAPFDSTKWIAFLQDFFHPDELRREPLKITEDDSEGAGYYVGKIETSDHVAIELLIYEVNSSVVNKRVGLRNLAKSCVSRGGYDAALAIFNSGDHWRLSFISDIKGKETAPKRFSFVFGDSTNYYNTPVYRFVELQRKGISAENIEEAFSVEALTKQFYNELFEWYEWAVSDDSGIRFPKIDSVKDNGQENIETKIIRMITRIMFLWFIKQKQLVPNSLFNIPDLKKVLKDFDPFDEQRGTYYNAILQNLFFATLNRAIKDEEGKQRAFVTEAQKDIKTLYRYGELFSISEEEVIRLFGNIPFLNGGLFECLDKNKRIDGVEQSYNYDGFTSVEDNKNRAIVPNSLFFKPEKGLFSILNRYNFTIEENTPNEQQVALDPELLGKVFENLLGAYNPETKETARKDSGSFYTPRPIVNYMVDECLKAYLGNSQIVGDLFKDDFIKDETKNTEYQVIAQKLKKIKVLDPACGSGAFPMGLLGRMVDILQKIGNEESTYQLKSGIIENCIYGSDIQSIASQITKLRFFISLICDCEMDSQKPNFGIPTLPNLETKFVAADSLIAKKSFSKYSGDTIDLFEDPNIERLKKGLIETRHQHFSAKTASQKLKLRKKDEKLRRELVELLMEDKYVDNKDAQLLASWDPYDQNAVSKFFDPGWMFGITDGFDIVIGNPPYIQLQKNGGALSALYKPYGYKSFAGAGDIYCLFYERGVQLLKEEGHLCYITSNKWMRTGYGEKLRDFFVKETNPKLLIDFGGVKVFESATVDTNILLSCKANNEHKTMCVSVRDEKDSIKNLSLFVKQHAIEYDFVSSTNWVILTPTEQSIKKKVEHVGTCLKNWNVRIYRGVLTGLNKAFIIDTKKRNEILSNCSTEDERIRTEELIRPILRGKDISRYRYEFANKWLINTHNGSKDKKRVNIDDYPAIKQHLDRYYKELVLRADQGDTPYNLRSCAYMDDFNKQKIMYSEITQVPQFYLDTSGQFYPEATTFIMTGDNLKYLLASLHSKLLSFAFKKFYAGGGLGEDGYRYKKAFLERLPILIPSDKINKIFEKLLEEKNYIDIDRLIYRLYGLTAKEIDYVNTNI